MASLILSYAYWLVFNIMKPEEHLVFAANEVSEWAYFLMLGSSLMYAVKSMRRSAVSEYFGVFGFTAFNVILWIAWSGEWVQDILTGLAMAYWAYHLVRGLKTSNAVCRREWIGLCILFTVVIAAQAVTFLPKVPVDTLYLISFLLLAAILLYLYGKTAVLLRAGGGNPKEAEEENPASPGLYDAIHNNTNQKIFCLAFLILILTSAGMYMSGDPYYIIFLASSPLTHIIAYIPLRREAVQG